MTANPFFLTMPWLALAALCAVAPANAQIQGSEAGLTLSGYLTTLSEDPRDVRALIGAGRAALELGDTEAAIGFFTRAEAVDPRSGQPRLGMALVSLAQEKPNDALKQFEAAIRLGVPEAQVARDRGLAYDLRGEPRRAQRDYAAALKRGADDETVRRYALSLAISGDRDQALAMLDPLLLKQDRAAWRARAFVLAMSGDVAGARGIADAVMPAVAAPMTPFFARLGGLTPAQRAAAVHFGHFPADSSSGGRIMTADGPLIPAGNALGAPPLEAQPVKLAARVSKEPRRRPGKEGPSAVSVKPVQIAAATLPKPVPQTASTVKALAKKEAPAGKIVATILPVKSLPLPSHIADKSEAKPAIAPAKTETTPQIATSVKVALADLPLLTRRTLEKWATPDATKPVGGAEVPVIVKPSPLPVETKPVETASVGTQSFDAVPVPGFATLLPGDFSLPAAAPDSVLETKTEVAKPESPAPAVATTETVSLAAIVADLKIEPLVSVQLPGPVTAQSGAAIPSGPKVEKPMPVAATKIAALLPKLKPETLKPGSPKSASAKPETVKPDTGRPGAKLAAVKVSDAKASVVKPGAKKAADKKAIPAKPDPKKTSPARIWAQIATGANPKALAFDYGKLTKKSPAVFKGMEGYSVPFKGTRRLLVGPFTTEKKAQDFLKKAGITGFPFESPAGMEIEKLPGK